MSFLNFVLSVFLWTPQTRLKGSYSSFGTWIKGRNLNRVGSYIQEPHEPHQIKIPNFHLISAITVIYHGNLVKIHVSFVNSAFYWFNSSRSLSIDLSFDPICCLQEILGFCFNLLICVNFFVKSINLFDYFRQLAGILISPLLIYWEV